MTARNGPKGSVRGDVARLVILLGDQLQHDAPLLEDLDPDEDAILMMEVVEESRHVPSHKARTALFLSAMRHFAIDLEDRGLRVRYVRLDDEDNTGSFSGEIRRAVKDLRPESMHCIQPGEHRVLELIEAAAGDLDLPLTIHEDTHFLTTIDEFRRLAKSRGVLMEHFYRKQRKRLRVLMRKDGEPVGETWNFDKSNRESFGKDGPDPSPPVPRRFKPDDVTKDVFRTIEKELSGLPGSLEGFGWPVTRDEALEALEDFIENRLPNFGRFQDAMWTGERTLWHSVISPAINQKLLDPREVVLATLDAYNNGDAPIESVEGFIRQIIGWREFIRGVYWREGAEYAERNHFEQEGNLPELYWTGETDMVCMRECVTQVLDTGHGHHIQRLMVTGNFALLAGVHPRAISDWYLGMYVDAVDWVTLPNTLGMAMHADGGIVGSKPYIATGQYIRRMSNYCEQCPYDPAKRHGDDACPFTVLYWDFLIRNERTLSRNSRMNLMLGHLKKMKKEERVQITVSASKLRDSLGVSKEKESARS